MKLAATQYGMEHVMSTVCVFVSKYWKFGPGDFWVLIFMNKLTTAESFWLSINVVDVGISDEHRCLLPWIAKLTHK